MKALIGCAGTSLLLLAVPALAQLSTQPSGRDTGASDELRQRAADRDPLEQGQRELDQGRDRLRQERDELRDRSMRDRDRSELRRDRDLSERERQFRDRDLRDREWRGERWEGERRSSGRSLDRDRQAWDDSGWQGSASGYAAPCGSPCVEGSAYGSGATIYGTSSGGYVEYGGINYGNLTYRESPARSADRPGFVPYGPSGGCISGTSTAYLESESTFDRGASESYRLTGRIMSMRLDDTGISGEPEDLIVSLKTEGGETVLINVGERERIAELDLQLGDEVTIRGNRFRLDERGRRLASILEFRGEQIRLQPGRQLQGEILATREESIGGEQHLIARVRLDNGRIQIVDLGRAEGLRNVDLREGDRIQLRAHEDEFERDRLVATQIRANGRTIDIDQGESMRLRGQPVSPRDRDMRRDMDRDRQRDMDRDRQRDLDRDRQRDLDRDQQRDTSRDREMDRSRQDREQYDSPRDRGMREGQRSEFERERSDLQRDLERQRERIDPQRQGEPGEQDRSRIDQERRSDEPGQNQDQRGR